MTALAKKVFYPADEACARLGITMVELAVLVSEEKITLSTAVPGLVVEEGRYETAPDGARNAVAESTLRVRGLVPLRPDDGWYVLRSGSQMIFSLGAEPGRYRRIVSGGDDERGYTVIREEVGVTHAELLRYDALLQSLDDEQGVARPGRGGPSAYDWRAADLEAFRRIYFEGVPESQGALIRHMTAWFSSRGGKVPNESTLKRQLRHIWAQFGSEAKPNGP
ncbi:hypothetical protein [Roseomonas sp. AR75]|uniref:hypothetical protein n=1 Tax=Roseomonas sp. AR75 TaxID=2562311 RepID=UPI0010C0FFAD|nr:hypothetical protein [Roseomonas sp. AR75]